MPLPKADDTSISSTCLPPLESCSPNGLRALAAIESGSAACRRYLRADPSRKHRLVQSPYLDRRQSLASMKATCRKLRAASCDLETLLGHLTQLRVDVWLRLVAKEFLTLSTTQCIVAEWSDLTQAVVHTIVQYIARKERSQFGRRLEAHPQKPSRPAAYAVLAQGKLGGYELNLSSDIDIQFLHSSDAGDGCELFPRFRRIATETIRALQSRSADGWLFRVDCDLRPEGRSGAITNSLWAAETYYETFGQPWERLALVRSRHLAGHAWVSQAFLKTIAPFVFPRSLHPSQITEVLTLKERVAATRKARSKNQGIQAYLDLKSDPGGIRDLEFFVQINQLLYAGRHQKAQSPSTFIAVKNLLEAHIIDEDTAKNLRQDYAFLRRLENIVQAQEERQEHRWPILKPQERLAAYVSPSQSHLEVLNQITQTMERTRSILNTLGEAEDTSSWPDHLVLVLFGDTQEAQETLSKLGWHPAPEALGLLRALAAHKGGVFAPTATEAKRTLAMRILMAADASSDPVQVMRGLISLDAHWRLHPHYYTKLREDPRILSQLVALLAASPKLSATLLRSPASINHLSMGHLRPEAILPLKNPLSTEAWPEDLEHRLNILRQRVAQTLLKIGVADIVGDATCDKIAQAQSQLADDALMWVHRWAAQEHPQSGLEQRLVVLALGRLGACEMGYGSDLDLIFIEMPQASSNHDADIESPQHVSRMALRMAQRMIHMLTCRMPAGILYPIDTRLRPSGAQGPLVSTAQGFLRYHRSQAQTWEHQSLLRARVVAGNPKAAGALLEALVPVLYPKEHLPWDAATAPFLSMRKRLEKEIGQETAQRIHLKAGSGGMLDILFLLQFLAMRHAHRCPSMRIRSTSKLIDAAKEAGLLDMQQHQTLQSAHLFYADIENRLRIAHAHETQSVCTLGPELDRLARRLANPNIPNGESLWQSLHMHKTKVRAVFEQVFTPDHTHCTQPHDPE